MTVCLTKPFAMRTSAAGDAASRECTAWRAEGTATTFRCTPRRAAFVAPQTNRCVPTRGGGCVSPVCYIQERDPSSEHVNAPRTAARPLAARWPCGFDALVHHDTGAARAQDAARLRRLHARAARRSPDAVRGDEARDAGARGPRPG